MTSKVVEKILGKYGLEDVLNLLGTKLSGSELNSLLVEVFRLRSDTLTPADLLKAYSENRFVKKTEVATVPFKQFEVSILAHLSARGCEVLEFGPTAPLGSCSVLGTISQNLVLGAGRNVEVVADVTNLMALESAKRKQADPQSSTINLAAAHRLTRCQPLVDEKHTAHFKILCLTTSGRDTGNCTFEVQALSAHINSHLEILTELLGVDENQLGIKLFHLENDNSEKLNSITTRVLPLCKSRRIEVVTISHLQKIYYRDLQFQINLCIDGQEYFIVDGGFVDWTQQLLQNKKERLMTSGMGTEYLFKVLNSCPTERG